MIPDASYRQTRVASNEQSFASSWQHEDVLLLFLFERPSAEFEVGDEEDSEKGDQTHEQGETVSKHALWREFLVLFRSVAKTTTAHDVGLLYA